MEGVTPDDRGQGYGSAFTFYAGDIEDAPKTGASDRRFSVIPSDGVAHLNSISNDATARFVKVVYVMVQYRVGRDLSVFLKRMHKDVDRLVYTLGRPSSWLRGDDWAMLKMVPAQQFFVDMDEVELGAVVHIPFEVTYSVDYGG